MYSSNIPRCQHIKVNGTQCGSPAVRDRRFCFFHKKWHDQRIVINSAQARQSPPTLDLPVLEDANSIQVALMQVMRLLISHQIDHKTAGLLLYALQTASFNLRRTDFEPVVKTKIVIDPTRVDETALGESQWQNEDFENPEETNEEEEEEAENGHLEIQAMAAPNSRRDRRLACPARKRRRSGRAGLGRAGREGQVGKSRLGKSRLGKGTTSVVPYVAKKDSASAAGGLCCIIRRIPGSRGPEPETRSRKPETEAGAARPWIL